MEAKPGRPNDRRATGWALMALRTYVAFDLASRAAQPELEARLAEIDACIDRVDGLWIERPPAELREGIRRVLALTGPELRERCRQYALEELSWESNVVRWEAALEEAARA